METTRNSDEFELGTPIEATSVGDEEVFAALDQILASENFARVERPSRFLRHVVESARKGNTAILKESLLGVDVFGREASWDPRADPVVRQEAARLRKRLARYYETAQPAVRIELPVGTYVPVFHRLQAAPVDQPLPSPQVRSVNSRSWLWPALALTLALVAAGAWLVYRGQPAPAPSIVVLPLVNLSADPSNEYFAAGLTSEIDEELTRLHSMKVLSRSSVRSYKAGTDVRQIKRLINAQYVLGGSIERVGDKLRIITHLDRVSDGTQVWAATFDRTMQDVLNVQAEVASAVARSLQVNAGLSNRHKPLPEAYDLFLRGGYELQNLTPTGIGRAEQYFQQAADLDPQYAGAWFGLGLIKFNKPAAFGRNRTAQELSEVKALYQKALALDPDYLVVRSMLALLMVIYDWDWAGAEKELREASRFGPNIGTEPTYAMIAAYHGRFAEADSHMRTALSIDPASAISTTHRAGLFFFEGRFEESIALCKQVLERFPNMIPALDNLAMAYIWSGKGELALQLLHSPQMQYPGARLIEVTALARLGRGDEAIKMMRELEPKLEANQAAFRAYFAFAWLALGDHTQAMKWLQRSAEIHEFQVLTLRVSPAFQDLRGDADFQALVKRIGLN